MNRYRLYLDNKPKPGKKTSEQIADEIAAYLAAGNKVQKVPRGATGLDTKPLGSMNRLGGR